MLSHDKNMQIHDTKASIILAGETLGAFPSPSGAGPGLPVTAAAECCSGGTNPGNWTGHIHKGKCWKRRGRIPLFLDYYLQKLREALAGVVQWIEHRPVNQRVAGLIPSQGTCLGCRPGPQ